MCGPALFLEEASSSPVAACAKLRVYTTPKGCNASWAMCTAGKCCTSPAAHKCPERIAESLPGLSTRAPRGANLGDEGLASAGVALEQDALGRLATHARVHRRVLQELHVGHSTHYAQPTSPPPQATRSFPLPSWRFCRRHVTKQPCEPPARQVPARRDLSCACMPSSMCMDAKLNPRDSGTTHSRQQRDPQKGVQGRQRGGAPSTTKRSWRMASSTQHPTHTQGQI